MYGISAWRLPSMRRGVVGPGCGVRYRPAAEVVLGETRASAQAWNALSSSVDDLQPPTPTGGNPTAALMAMRLSHGAKGCVSSKRPSAANALTNASWAGVVGRARGPL